MLAFTRGVIRTIKYGYGSGRIASFSRITSKRQRVENKDAPAFDGFETKAIHAGTPPDETTGARVTPIFQNTSYVFDSVDHAAALFNLQQFGNIYSRLTNPTTAALQTKIAALEGGTYATCTASGHSAQMMTLLALMAPGDRIVSSRKLYGGSITQFGKTIKKFGWGCEFVDQDDIEAVRAAVNADKSVKALFVESIANPGGVISDLSVFSEIAHEAGVPLIVDNTMATPYLCRPFEFGADIVVHSMTKFLSGQGNSMGGCIVEGGNFDWSAEPGRFPSMSDPDPSYHGLKFHETFGNIAFTIFQHAVGLRDLGATMAPMNAFLTLNGCETLAVRMKRHVENAQKVAEWLSSQPAVKWVSYAGLPSDPYYSLAQKYIKGGAGGSVFTFGINGGYEAGIRAVSRCELHSHLANIGDSRSLIIHPASTTHRQLTPEQRKAAGAGDDVIRISVGLETYSDIIADLDYAMAEAKDFAE